MLKPALMFRYFGFLALMFVSAGALSAQSLNDPTVQRGLTPYGTFEGGSIDSISAVNGALNLHIPLVSFPQRGGKLDFGFNVQWANGSYIHTTSSFTGCTTPPKVCEYGDDVLFGSLSITPTLGVEATATPVGTQKAFASLYTPDGATHEMAPFAGGFRTIDATGYLCVNNCASIIDRNGIRYAPGTSPAKIEDPNGNYITITRNSLGGSYLDTLNRTIQVPPAESFNSTGFTSDTSGCLGTLPTLRAYLWSIPGYQGASTIYKICYANVYSGANVCVKNGGLPTCGIQLTENALIQSILLPNNTSWTFEYDSADPSNPNSSATGNLLQITFPTGGYIKYTWGAQYYCQVLNATKATTYSYVVGSRTVNANDGTGEHTWTYGSTYFPQQSPSPYTTTTTDPLGQKVVHTMTSLGGTCSFYETETQFYDASSNLLKTVNTDYHADKDPLQAGMIQTNAANVVPIRVTTTWPNGQVSKVETTYDSGVPISSPYPATQILYVFPKQKRNTILVPGRRARSSAPPQHLTKP